MSKYKGPECMAVNVSKVQANNALSQIREILYLDIDEQGHWILNTDKEWDADTIDRIAEVIASVT